MTGEPFGPEILMKMLDQKNQEKEFWDDYLGENLNDQRGAAT